MGHAITWFDEDTWIESEVAFDTFKKPQQSRWRLERKIAESATCANEWEVRECKMACKARGVFICSKVGDSAQQQAVMKIRMQIPYSDTVFKSREARAKQAEPDIDPMSQEEISALEYLTKVGCSSTPDLFTWKHEVQDDNSWAPGGYIDYILMEKVPGVCPRYHYRSMDREERDQLRAAFKEAWLECIACDIDHQDSGIRNLVWDRERRKCYIVDWEHWEKTTNKNVWNDHMYILWNLAYVPHHNYDDMSTWEL